MKTHVHAIAFDRGSARSVDAQGFLHVDGCNISKACVNPYFGAEIPDYESLGLQSDKVYHLLRDPKELEKGASTFNSLPLMDDHVAVGTDELNDPEIKERVAGATGTNARFEDPYLVNDLVVWTTKGIEGVMSKAQTQLSCAYRYKLDMTPGTFQGQPYDGRMYDIVGNHVALVDEGRAGPDVIVKDRKPNRLEVEVDMRNVVKLVNDALAPVKKALGMDGDDDIDSIVDALTVIKARVTKMKDGAKGEDAKALDDCTSAVDLAVHHLMDIKEDQDEGGVTTDGSRAIASDKIVHIPGHKDSNGKPAPWAVKSETTGKVIWSGGSKAEAVENLKRIEGHKAGAKDRVQSVTMDITTRKDATPAAGKQKYGSVKFADMKNKKYPIDTPDHVRSAATYWGRPKNRDIYSKEDQTTITNNIEAAKKKFKIGKYAESK